MPATHENFIDFRDRYLFILVCHLLKEGVLDQWAAVNSFFRVDTEAIFEDLDEVILWRSVILKQSFTPLALSDTFKHFFVILLFYSAYKWRHSSHHVEYDAAYEPNVNFLTVFAFLRFAFRNWLRQHFWRWTNVIVLSFDAKITLKACLGRFKSVFKNASVLQGNWIGVITEK